MANIQYEVRRFGFIRYEDITDRIASIPTLEEGPDQSSLGTGLHRPRPTTIDINLNNSDLFFTRNPGTRKLAEPGAQLRIRLNGNDWFIGKLVSRRGVDDAVLHTEWAGSLWAVTSAATGASDRLLINKTPAEIFDAIAEAQGVPVDNVVADAGGTAITRVFRPGVEGLADLVDAADVSIYNNREGQMVMELPTTRAARAVTRRYTDTGTPNANEKGIPRPRDLEDAFGIINYAESKLIIYYPTSAVPDSRTFDIPSSEIVVARNQGGHACITWNSQALISAVATAGYTVTFSYENLSVEITQPDDAVTLQGTASNGDIITVEITNFEIIKDGTTLGIAFDYDGGVTTMDAGEIAAFIAVDGTVTVDNGDETASPMTGHSLDYASREFVYRAVDASSIQLFGGIRPREKQVVIALVLDVVVADDFTPNQESVDIMKAAAQREIDEYRSAISVYEVDHSDEDDILERRLGDVEHLRLADGTDEEFYVEVMRTPLDSVEPLTQEVVYVAKNRTRQPFVVPAPALVQEVGVDSALGAWSDGTTIWFATGSEILAFNRETLSRDSSNDISIRFVRPPDPPERGIRGIWSDGVNIWVTASTHGSLLMKASLTAGTQTVSAANVVVPPIVNLQGGWSDGTTVWFSGPDGTTRDKLYAFTLATLARDASKDFDLTDANHVFGAFTVKSGTLYVINNSTGDLANNAASGLAYNWQTGTRDPSKDFDVPNPSYLYTAMWDNGDGTAYLISRHYDNGVIHEAESVRF